MLRCHLILNLSIYTKYGIIIGFPEKEKFVIILSDVKDIRKQGTVCPTTLVRSNKLCN